MLRAASRSFSDSTTIALDAASNSGHFCQISGLAFDFSVSEPCGNIDGMCCALIAIVSAFTAMASKLPALPFAWASAQLAPFSFIRRWRSATMSPDPTMAVFFSPPAHPASATAIKPQSTTPRRTAGCLMSPPL